MNSNVYFLSYWFNLIVATLTGAWNGVLDFVGLYNPPTSAPVVPDGPGSTGKWEGPFSTPIIGVAAANLPNGKLLIWSAYARDKFSQPDVFQKGQTHTAIIDPFRTEADTEELVVNTQHDMFCPGTAYLPDHTVMITGGATNERTTVFDLDTNSWRRGPDMVVPRGYHSMTLLGDGSVFSFGGSFTGGIGRKNGEIWTPHDNAWRVLSNVNAEGSVLTDDAMGVEKADNHMWLFTAPGTDKLFHPGPSRQTHWIDLNGDGQIIPSVKREDKDKMCGCAVMYDVGKILVLGGSNSQDTGLAHREAFVFDIREGENVQMERVGDLVHARVFANAVVLPSGQVVVAGGQTQTRKFSDLGGVLQAELFDPETKTFTPMSSMQFARNYHSACILLKDARVACMGGGLCVDWDLRACGNHFDYEIFTPPYLLDANMNSAVRPQIVGASTSAVVGDIVSVDTDKPCTFSIVRLGAVTHTINNDLRRIPLPAETVDGNTYTLRLPSNPNVALPGLYWLFALDDGGVPSEGWNLEVVLS